MDVYRHPVVQEEVSEVWTAMLTGPLVFGLSSCQADNCTVVLIGSCVQEAGLHPMSAFFAELVGTMILVMLGDGVPVIPHLPTVRTAGNEDSGRAVPGNSPIHSAYFDQACPLRNGRGEASEEIS